MEERERIMGLPRPAKPGEAVAIDSEFYYQEGTRPHRASGNFAAATFAFSDQVYMITDSHDLKEALERVAPGIWVFQNAQYDLRQFRRFTTVKEREVWDTMLIEQTMFGGYYNSFSLGSLARRWLLMYLEKETRDEFCGANEMTPDMIDYSFLDAEITLDVFESQLKEIDSSSLDHYWLIEQPMIWTVLAMPGIRVDKTAWGKSASQFKRNATRIQNFLGINVKSVPQRREFLADLTGDDWSSKSTSDKVLESLVENYGNEKVSKMVAMLRKGTKMRDMSGAKYGYKWVEKFVGDDGLVHAEWRIIGADTTGRMSCANPNLQNIPIREFPIFRTFFIPSPGHILIDYDAAQQEPRITAALSGDQRLTKAIKDGVDLHQAAADAMAELLGPNHQFTKLPKSEQRRIGKAINLGVTYGETAKGLSYNLDTTEDTAQKFLDAYFAQFPGVSSMIDRFRTTARGQGYVETMTGRKCWINPYSYRWPNNAINSPVQGTAAAHIKLAATYNRLMSEDRGLPFAVNAIIHDELLMDAYAPLRDVYEHIAIDSLQESWGKIVPNIPLEVEGGVGMTWKEAKDAGKND